MWRMILMVLCSAGCVAIARAQDAGGDNNRSPDGRYVFSEVDEGIVRLDTRSGDVSLCTRQTPGWICRLVPDERGAVDAELARLQTQNAELRKALAERAAPEQSQPAQPPATRSGGPLIRLPDGNDVKYAASVVVHIWRRLVEMMANLKSDLQQKT